MGDVKSSEFHPSLPDNRSELDGAKQEASMSIAEKAAAHVRAKEANRALMKDVFGKKEK